MQESIYIRISSFARNSKIKQHHVKKISQSISVCSETEKKTTHTHTQTKTRTKADQKRKENEDRDRNRKTTTKNSMANRK